jgi:UPF0271 protein
MGEGLENEAQLIPFISAANIACGYHAGNEETMQHVIRLCLENNVHIGAHPSFDDRENFGRTAIQLPVEEIYNLITAQLEIINKTAIEYGAKLHHVKAHGALYNMAAKDKAIAKAIAQAVKDFDVSLIYYGLSGSVMIEEAAKLGLITANEVFADRTYQYDGSLTPRSQKNALIDDSNELIKQVTKFINENKVTTVTGEDIFLKADTICIHGDGANAVEFAKAIYESIHKI